MTGAFNPCVIANIVLRTLGLRRTAQKIYFSHLFNEVKSPLTF